MFWVLSLSPRYISTPRLPPGQHSTGIRSLVGGGTAIPPPGPIQCSTSCELISRGYTKIYFGENQLSPSLIGLSPLPSSHPSGFQPTSVRSSTACYGGFNLLKGRSPRLRVYDHVRDALIRLAFALAPALKALTCT